MNINEMKSKLHELIDKEFDGKKLQEAIAFLSTNTFREISAEEVFEEISGKYNETLKKLANPDHIIKNVKRIDIDETYKDAVKQFGGTLKKLAEN